MKKALSLLLTVLMTLCVFSVNVMAFDEEPNKLEVKVEYVVHANPKLTMPSEKTIFKGETFTPLDVVESAKDDEGTDLKADVKVNGQYDINTVGSYTLTYAVTDKFGGSDTKELILNVINKIEEVEDTKIEQEVKLETKAPVQKAEANFSAKTIIDSVVRENAKKDSELTEKQKDAIKNGADVNVNLVVDKSNATIEEVDKIEKEVKNNNSDTKIGTLLDISLLCTVTQNNIPVGDPSKITKTSEKVKVTVTISDDLVNTDSTVTRGYDVARLHDGKVELLGASYDAASKKLSFDTDRFSTYAIVYTDTKVEKPKKNASSSSSSGYKKPVVNTGWGFNPANIEFFGDSGSTKLEVDGLPECNVLTVTYDSDLELKSADNKIVNANVEFVKKITKNDSYTLTVKLQENAAKPEPGIYEGTVIVSITSKEYEARIGDVYYEKLQEALDNVDDGKTVILLKDVSGDGLIFKKDIKATLDLNKHTYKSVSNGNKTSNRVIKIIRGYLTIQNGTLDARNVVDGTDDRNDSAMYGTVRVDGGNVVLKDLTLYNNHDWGMSIKICTGNTGVIENCKVYSKVGGGLEAEGGMVTIRNSTFNQTGSNSKFPYIASGVAVSCGGIINIYNSGFTTEGDYALYVFSSGGTINVYGGEYKASQGVLVLQQDTSTYPDGISSINIYDGVFEGNISCNAGDKNKLSIMGGTFTANPNVYVKEGYAATIKENKYVVSTLAVDEEDNYLIKTADDLVLFEKLVNDTGFSFIGKTVKLINDIDLQGINWKPVGQTGGYSAKTYFQGIFDGNGKTISNLTIPASVCESGTNQGKNFATGFFGFVDNGKTVIKNVTFTNANVSGHHWVGVATGYMTGDISGVTVKDSTVSSTYKTEEADGDKAGGIVGYLNSGSIKKCSVIGSTISAIRDCGSIVGNSSINGTVSENKASDCTVYYSTDDPSQAGGEIAGARANGVANNTATNVSVIKKVTVKDSTQFSKALKTNGDVIIDLDTDVTYDITPWINGTGTMGGANTDSITINGNNHKITFNNTNSDWNGIYIANENAVLTINNASLTNSGYNDGPWNRHDINFNCKVVLNNAISDKAIALAKDSTLKNVEISDNRDDNDYLLWIQTCGETVNVVDCKLNNTKTINTTRGIAVKDQYNTNPEYVKLNVSGTQFITSEKSAVIVTSTAGAEINWGERNDISQVSADTVNAVWVDSARTDFANLVTVIGCTKINEQ